MTEPNLEPAEPEVGPEAKFRANLLLQWFVFPMLAVALCVGLYLSFRMLTAENKTVSDYVNDLRSGNPHRAWQAAFSIANQVNQGRIADQEIPLVGRQFLAMLDESSPSAGEIRQYFILTLGRLKYREAIPKLVDIARGDDATEKIYAFLALSEMHAPEGIDAARTALENSDAGVRKTAANYFGRLARELLTSDSTVPSAIRPLLNDKVTDVRWNAAISLAEYRDPAAVPVLSTMLDRAAVESELKLSGGLDETKIEKIIKAALAASSRFSDPGLGDRVRVLAEADPQPAIQTAAREIEKRLKETK